MRRLAPLLTIALVSAASPAAAQRTGIEAGMGTAFAACREWVLHPATWAENLTRFPEQAGLSGRIRPQLSIPEVALPPPAMRQANHYWHVPVGAAGLYVTVSDRLPICHIAGGGADDWQPAAEAFLASSAFRAAWTRQSEQVHSDIRTTRYVSAEEPRLTIIVSRARTAGERVDRVQFLATAVYDFSSGN